MSPAIKHQGILLQTADRSLIVKKKHSKDPDGHQMFRDRSVLRDRLGRNNASGGSVLFDRYMCHAIGCSMEILVDRDQLETQLGKLTQ